MYQKAGVRSSKCQCTSFTSFPIFHRSFPPPDLLGESYADANKTGFHWWEKTEISLIYKPVKYELKDG